MGFFDRKKVRKTAPEPVPVPVKPAPVNGPSHYHASPPPPPASSRYATSTTQTPTYWQPQPQQQGQQGQYHHPPPPYHRPQPQPQQQQQHQVQQQRPQGWPQYPQRGQYPQPIVVNQHYYLHPPPAATAPAASHAGAGTNPYSPHGAVAGASATCPSGLDKFAGSMVTIAKDFTSPHFLEEPNFHPHATQLINSTAACVDQIAGCFNDVMTLIDRERLVGNEKALFSYQNGGAPSSPPPGPSGDGKRGGAGAGAGGGRGARGEKGGSGGAKKRSKEKQSSSSKVQSTAVTASVVSGNYFAKVELYANSRLPMNLPPLRLYMPTWPLLCMAAQYAERVYDHPKGAERDTHVSADWKTGTKAMVIKSVPMDHMNTIVFAIRGSATFMDWAVNLNTAPASPAGFLDDPGNSCHAGFLTVAKKMVKPVAARLRQLLEEDPGRSSYSLLITGHSAGGAVASLLYSHMLATSRQAESELNILTGCFKRVHCVTFGTPPVSLLPLKRPDRPELRKSLFLTFVNEGDPVARADKAYVRSLLELFASPAPGSPKERRQPGQTSSALVVAGSQEREKKASAGSRLAAKASKMSLRPRESKASLVHASKEPRDSSERDRDGKRKPVWHLPPSTLSSPGRIVVLRSGDPRAGIKDRKTVGERLDEGVVAQTVSDEELRGVVWGDPVCHVMRLYSGRIEILAVGAVTGKHG
ncbi:lipase class 3 [Colletotrichum tofieldiae]|uniref:Lipase class 3 n=1 Tax=Colletotrichum tofieldiae TaxID=708197 RepID=A0A166VX59_9PEZI|nr:lipase class 3 [Colletotrichum tofieldiae]